MSVDTTSLAALQTRYGPRYRWLLLLAVMVGTMASIMSSTIMNVAIPDMSRHFTLGQERAQWVTSGFMVAMTVAMLTTPWLLARFGYRRTYVGCMLLLMVGGVCGGLAGSYGLVLAARVTEGLAAGAVQPIPAIIIMRAFDQQEQGRASSMFGMGVVLAPALGPSVGGVLVDWFGWRSIFFVVVPFCVAALYMAWRYVPTTAPGGVAANSEGAALDWRGLLLAGGGTVCLLNGLVELNGHAQSSTLTPALTLLTVAGLLLVGFWLWQRYLTRSGGQPLMSLNLFSYKQFAMGSVVAFIYGTALFGSTYLLPVFMQMGLKVAAASHVGTVLLPAGLMLALTIVGVGRLVGRYSTHWLVSIGLALLALSFGSTALIDLHTSLWVLMLLSVVGRVGLGFILPSLNVGAMRGIERVLIPQGSSVINFVRMLGGSIGVSLCGIGLEWRLAARGELLSNPGTSAARLAAFDDILWMLALLCLLAVGVAWRMRPQKVDSASASDAPVPAPPATSK